MRNEWNDKIFKITTRGFEELALEIFHFQYSQNAIYKAYADALSVRANEVTRLTQIPFLPASLFKTHEVRTTDFNPQIIFQSSGTTASVNSSHFVKNLELYEHSFLRCFELFYGSIKDWCIIGLLPSYLERKDSSLVWMVNEFIRQCHHPAAGFYLTEFEKLYNTLSELETANQKTLLIGVSFALLDFAERYSLHLRNTIVMETGGMKGRRKELIRQELHQILKEKFFLDAVHSEYGMTELLSQAYSKTNGVFYCPPWMKVLVRDEEDPLQVNNDEIVGQPESTDRHSPNSRRGIINVIDLVNVYSCSFIATEDAGNLFKDGSFEVLGRIDNSDVRGCSLLAL